MLICLVPVAPLRSEPSHRSEMVSQLLFGELCEPLETNGDFVKVKMHYDNYEGWCQSAQLTNCDHSEQSKNVLAGEWSNSILINGTAAMIPFGSSISFLQETKTCVKDVTIEYSGAFILPTEYARTEESIKRVTDKFLNTPYLWGGRSVFGTDCSGFTQLVFKCFNIYLHRDAAHQATQGEAIGFLQEAQPGDLAFFDNSEGKIMHVGILLNAHTIIHSSGKVRIDSIDNIGIVNSDNGKRTHQLRVVKRIGEKS